MRRRLALLGLKMGLALASVSMVFLMFEVGLRILGYEALYDIYSKPSALWRHDPLLGWHHEPNSTDTFIGPRPWPIEFETPIEINSMGLRGPEVPEKAPEELRLLFLGDSMVAAFEVPYEQTFPVLAAAELERRFGRPVRAINGGVRGYGTDQSLLFYRERGRLLEPDVVVLFHSRNDLVNNTTIHRMRRAFGKGAFTLGDDGEVDLVGVPVPDYPVCSEYSARSDGGILREDGVLGRTLCNLQRIAFDRSSLFSFITLRVPWDPDFLRSLYYFAIPRGPRSIGERSSRDYARELTISLIEMLDREVEANGSKLVVTGEPDQLEELGLDALAKAEVEVQPLVPFDRADRDRFHFSRDSHYNRQGHIRVAESLLPRLEARLGEVASMHVSPGSELVDRRDR